MKKAYLILGNGLVFEGSAFGAVSETVGELVFTTGMGGYLETLTDPSYAGQIVLQTYPLIGNYGVIPADFEGTPALNGYVVREYCESQALPSNFRSECDIDTYMKENGIVGICGVDTRELTRIIRECGVMNAAICYSLPFDTAKIKDYKIVNPVKAVSTDKRTVFEPDCDKNENPLEVVLIDYGAKSNIVRSLNSRGCRVTVVPFNTPAREILSLEPDGIMLSNGPGDPAENTGCIAELAALMGRVPIFGICLGHQLFALAAGGKTLKLKYGHRGTNVPVRDLFGVRTYITTQNHGYAVDINSIPQKGKLRFINANDGTCEGISYPELNAFTVQFHPEACAGPHDTAFLFDEFISAMNHKGVKTNASR